MKFRIDPERFWSKVTTSENGCWCWNGSTNRKGYGTFSCRPANPQLAHRIAWILQNGEIPEGRWVLHRCDEPSCVRPSHLFLGDHDANMRDMAQKGRHWTRKRPELIKRGDEHYYRQRPEEIRRGEGHGSSKLTDAAVIALRIARLAGATYSELSTRFKISRSQAYRIANGSNWSHLTPR